MYRLDRLLILTCILRPKYWWTFCMTELNQMVKYGAHFGIYLTRTCHKTHLIFYRTQNDFQTSHRPLLLGRKHDGNYNLQWHSTLYLRSISRFLFSLSMVTIIAPRVLAPSTVWCVTARYVFIYLTSLAWFTLFNYSEKNSKLFLYSNVLPISWKWSCIICA